MMIEMVFFLGWIAFFVGVCYFRYATSKTLGSVFGKHKTRMDGSYWGVYSHTDP